ncbi:hypothetical protein [Yinghuangia soli]|uniref:LppX_LprAFG lipoprotein n=1 Tax=Yinghuangia soli TaxID=2908204 RepID=A0AA41U294_9ACTN|nr:hypothetical protein [Yinghuangia soli]MCF2528377.1 hypothetical protein [Yinghuangia soli]
MRKHLLGTAVGAMSLALLLAGCSGGSDDPESTAGSASGTPTGEASPAPSGTAADSTAASGSSAAKAQSPAVAALAAKLGSSRTKLAAVTSVEMKMTQVIDGQRTFDIDAESRFAPDNVARMTMTYDAKFLSQLRGTRVTEPMSIETLVTPTAMYMNLGPEAAAKNGAPWVKLDAEEMRKADKTGAVEQYQKMAEEGSGGQQDPAAQLALLQKSGDIKEIGEETVGGVKTTHYKGVVDLPLLQANNAASLGLQDKDYKQLSDLFSKMGVREAGIDLWIGADQLPVKQTTTITVKAKGQTAEVATTVEYVKWNVPVDVTPPPAGQTVSITDLIARGKM